MHPLLTRYRSLRVAVVGMAVHQASPDRSSGARSTVLAWPWVAEGAAPHGLIIRLIIQTIRLDRSGSVWIDEASNLSRPDRSGADQIDAEHQATDLAVREFVEPDRVAAGYRLSRSRSLLVS